MKSLYQIGLVIKWYFNDGPLVIYQWIVGQKPQAIGILKGKVDLNYEASKQIAYRHKALRIVQPTTELSGIYKCVVSTFENEDFMSKRMIVYGK